MISELNIQNFKSHANTALHFSNLNIFTGVNGMGKSSVIQALLLLRQAHQNNMLDKGLELKGNLCRLGTAEDAIYQSAEDDNITFSLRYDNNKQSSWMYGVNRNKPHDNFIKLKDTKKDKYLSYKSISLFNNGFQYISAFRNGPVDYYDKNTSVVELLHQISQKDGRCELVAHYLDYFGNESIIDATLKKNADDEFVDLKYQTAQWLREISPEIDIHITANETSYKIDYDFNRGSGKTPTNKFRAYNVGFGISYALPIIVAALHSPKGSLVIIENPEAHLHPEAIASLMELIAKAAKAGIQFIVETHSDHIINGMLVAAKKGFITPNDISVYHFDREKTMHQTTTTHLPVLEGGKIKRPPKGFFDRMDKDLDILMDM